MRQERLLSPLAHVELLTTDLEKSVDFAHDILGMDVVEQVGDTVYLRCWGDYYLYSLALTASDTLGLGHASWRAEGPEQLEEAVRRVEASGLDGSWIDDSFGHGRAYRFVGPAGHQHELFWDVERAVAPAGEESCYPERPQRTQSRGVGVRILDHLTVTAPDVQEAARWVQEQMGSRIMAAVELQPGAPWVFAVTTNNEKAHDLGFGMDPEGQRGRINHLAFWVETNHDLTEGAKFILEHGHTIDTGPGNHGIGEQNYLYFRDPVGLRYELNSGGYRNYVPDWEPVIWSFDQGANNAYMTEIGMPAVSMVMIPPGVAGEPDSSAQSPEAAALTRS
jgi:catechol 2,3-dioxygenase